MAETYKLKTIQFLGRRVPIVVQNENGPCPMLALANVMLLKNQIHLSPEAPDVTQERLLSLIAGHLLDVNAKGGVSDEQAANMARIMADAVELLPKLTTGIDVNVIFTDIRGFEYTDAIAIFDLLDIHLVHGWLVDPQDQETAAAIGGSSYNALMERMVALTGRASLTPAASQDSQQPPVAAKTPASSAAEQEASAGKGTAERACESPAGLLPQHTANLLQTKDGHDAASSSALSKADASAAAVMSGKDSAAASKSVPAAASHTAATSVPPGVAGKPVTAEEAMPEGVHAGVPSVPHPTAPSEGSSEADQLDLALKLSLNDAEQGSAAALSGSTAAYSSGEGMQPHAAGHSSAKDLPESSKSHAEAPAAAHAALTADTPDLSAQQPVEGSQHAGELDHDFVVVEPEEAPGAGFEQVDMPKMGNESASGSQEQTSAPAAPAAGHPQQTADPSKDMAEGPTADTSQHGLSSPYDKCSKAAPAGVSVKSAGAAAEQPTGAAEEQMSGTPTDASTAESKPQQAAALDERAKALLAALPKPGPSEGSSALPPEPISAAALRQHQPAPGEDAEKAASGSDQKASDDAEGQKPGRLGTAAASPHQIARSGSTKEAYLIQSFLDNASSQLTEHGLVSLHQGLKPRQLAILFRNNHFNTLFKFEDALYLLVTDQGYLHEQDVVWEKLDAIDGNTVYVGSQIRPPDPAKDSSTSDHQLAMLLQQQEEEEHQQREAARRQQPGQQSGQPGQAPAAQPAPSEPPQTAGRGSHPAPGPSQIHQRRGRGAYRSQRHGQAAHAAGRGSGSGSGSSSRDCTTM